MKQFIEESYSLTFAARILEWLDEPKRIGTGARTWREALHSSLQYHRVEGLLSLSTHGESGETVVPIMVFVHPMWMEFGPSVFCYSPFIRGHIDWHIYADGSLCYVHPEEWAWKLNQWWSQKVPVDRIMAYAAAWFHQNMNSLITRHLHGHRLGRTDWPKQWDQRSHGDVGTMEFRRFLRDIDKAAA